MELVALGVGDAFTAKYHSTCAAVRAGGATLLIDCPHPIRKVMADAGAGIDVGDLCGVVITHLHADHVSGLEGLLFYAHFVLQRRMTVLAHPDVLADLWDGHLRAGMHQLMQADGSMHPLTLGDVADVVPLSDRETVGHGPFSIDCRRTVHHIPTFAMQIRAGGASLGWSADTAFDESLIAWLAQCDRFVHETNLGVHTPYEKLAALPAAVRARMWINHYPDAFDLQSSIIEPLRQGSVYRVG